MIYWGIAALIILACLLTIFLPMLRARQDGGTRAGYDMQVYHDQLREVETELARGVLTASEAEASRTEISRRLLAAADEAEREKPGETAPRGLTVGISLGVLALAVVSTVGIYAVLGMPGMPDQPLADRERLRAEARANRPSQTEMEERFRAHLDEQGFEPPAAPAETLALIDRLETVLADRPDDADGHRLLAGSLSRIGRPFEARAAQQKVIDIMGEDASARDLINLAELSILAANGYVSPQAEDALDAGLRLEPTNPIGRYYAGLTLLQADRADLAYPIWEGLLREGPPDAPWIPAIRADIAEVARLAGLPPPDVPAMNLPGPSAEDMQAAEAMDQEDREAMIAGMVAQLESRLADEGGTPEEWARLISSHAILGNTDHASDILEEARRTFAGDDAALGVINDAASNAGLDQ